MADPLSITSGIIAVLQLASAVVQYLNAVKDASDDRQKLTMEIGSVTGFLYLLKDSAEKSIAQSAPSSTLSSLCVPSGPLTLFGEELNQLATKLAPAHGRFRKAAKALRWPFQKSEIASIFSRIERLKTMFGLALSNDSVGLTRMMAADVSEMREDVKSITYAVGEVALRNQGFKYSATSRGYDGARRMANQPDAETLIDYTVGCCFFEEYRNKLLSWLSPLDFRPKHHDVLSRHHAGTGQWLLQCPEFVSWLGGSPEALWCSGGPGVGKTVLTSIVIEHIKKQITQQQDLGLAYIYCSYQDPEHSSDNLLASILCQLLQHQSTLSQRIETFHKTHIADNKKPSPDGVLAELQALSKKLTGLYIVVDALDECSENDGTRVTLLEKIQMIGRNVRLLVTSRTHARVSEQLPKATSIRVTAKDDDVLNYLQSRITTEDKLQRNIGSDADLRALIISSIVQKAEGMFLLAKLHMDTLAKKHNRRDIRLALGRLPKELYGTYDELSGRIFGQDEEDADLAKKTLTWIIYSKRPLTVLELQHALAVEAGDSDIDRDALIDEEVLMSVCLGIVAIESATQVVRFIHYTVQEYFLQHPIEGRSDAQAMIASACLAYLAFDTFADGIPGGHARVDVRHASHPFFSYAADYWGLHMQNVDDPKIVEQALTFLADEARLVSTRQLSLTHPWHILSRHIANNFHGLHVVSRFGLHCFFPWLDQPMELDINQQDNVGQTPLSVAAYYGQSSMVDFLLSQPSIDIEAGDSTNCGTALHAATRGSRIECLKQLVCAGSNVDAGSSIDGSALNVAASSGDLRIVKYLLSKGAFVDATNGSGETPLSQAAAKGSVRVVQRLVSAGALVNHTRKNGSTPLYQAVISEHLDVVKYLLANGADATIRPQIVSFYRATKEWRDIGLEKQFFEDRGPKPSAEMVQLLESAGERILASRFSSEDTKHDGSEE